MFASISTSIRRLPVWAQAIAWPLYVILRVFVWGAEQLARLITRSASGFFGTVVSGGIMAVLAKIAGVILALGLISVGLGFQELGAGFITLSVAPIMLYGLVYMMMSVVAPTKKKKKKKK